MGLHTLLACFCQGRSSQPCKHGVCWRTSSRTNPSPSDMKRGSQLCAPSQHSVGTSCSCCCDMAKMANPSPLGTRHVDELKDSCTRHRACKKTPKRLDVACKSNSYIAVVAMDHTVLCRALRGQAALERCGSQRSTSPGALRPRVHRVNQLASIIGHNAQNAVMLGELAAPVYLLQVSREPNLIGWSNNTTPG